MAIQTDSAGALAAEWTVSAQADNGSAAATKALSTGLKHYVTALSMGYSAAPAAQKTASLSDGTTTYLRWFFTITDFGMRVVNFNPPLEVPVATAISVTVLASGTGGVLGCASIHGFSR